MALPRRAALLVAVACWVGVFAHEGRDVVEQLMAGDSLLGSGMDDEEIDDALPHAPTEAR